jgi:hypothetical protein
VPEHAGDKRGLTGAEVLGRRPVPW